jgi:hypothetical protein
MFDEWKGLKGRMPHRERKKMLYSYMYAWTISATSFIESDGASQNAFHPDES